eukprot:12427392-Ditylum_brightwellii.AAC.1
MEKGTTNVQRWTGWDIATVVCPNDIRNYQDGMGEVDKGDQHQALGTAFYYSSITWWQQYREDQALKQKQACQ